MKKSPGFALVVLLASTSAAYAGNITDTGPGSFSDISNSAALDYIAVVNGSIGNITNASGGALNGNTPTTISTNCCGSYAFGIGLDNTTLSGDIINNGTISQTNATNNVAGVLVANTSSAGGNIVNNNQIAITASGSNNAAGIFIDTPASVTGSVTNTDTIAVISSANNTYYGIYNNGTITSNVTNSSTITTTAGTGGNSNGIFNDSNGTITGNVTNSGTITATGGTNGTSSGIYNNGIITGSITNSGTITATTAIGGGNCCSVGIDNNGTLTGGEITNTGTITALGPFNDAYAILSAGNPLTINQNAGVLTGDIQLSGSDTLNINGGTVTGSIFGNSNADQIFLTDGALTVPSTGSINYIGTYTQGANGHLVLQVSSSGGSSISANTINLDGSLVISPQGNGFGLVNAYYNIINATTLNGSFSSVTSDAAQFTVGLTADGGNALDLTLIQPGLASSSNIIDLGPGSFSDINNASTLDYVAVVNGSVGNITNASNGVLNGNTPTSITAKCCQNWAFGIGLYNATLSGNITNNGTISQTNAANNVTGILVANTSSVGGHITNNGTMAIATSGSQQAWGIVVDTPAAITGHIANNGTITATSTTYSSYNIGGISNAGVVSGYVANSGTITATAGVGGTAYGIYNSGTIIGGITNTGAITAAGGCAICSAGTALTIDQNAGNIIGNIGLSGNGDTLNINGGTVTGSISGGGADQVHLIGGTLTVLPGGTVNGMGTYTQGADGTLVLQVSTAGSAALNAGTLNLDGALVIAPGGGGFLTPHTYTDAIDATTLNGIFSSVTSASPQFTVSLTPDGGNAYDLVVTWLGGGGAHTTDIGPGSFSDINNTSTVDYIALANGASIGNITNASTGVINGNDTPYVSTDSAGIFAASLSVNASTVTGNIINNGTINQTNAGNNIAGILVANSSRISGDVINNGQITLTMSSGNNGTAGILIDDTASVTGNVTNAGTITVTNNGASFYNLGIDTEGAITGSMTNSGTITVTSGDESRPCGLCDSIYSTVQITGHVTNSGTIMATSGNGGISWGIYNFNGNVTGDITNSGTIMATSGNGGTSYGIDNSNLTIATANLTNSGTIAAISGNGGTSYGLFSNRSTISGNLTNSGTIMATSGDGGTSYGILPTSSISGNLTNSGTIAATSGNGGTSYGIQANTTITGGLINTGTITATSGTDGTSYSIAGVNNLTNSGTIEAAATGGGAAWAIYDSGQGQTINQNDGQIVGDIGLSGNDALNINDGTVTGSIIGNVNNTGEGDMINLTGGMLTVPSNGSIRNIGTYTQGPGGTLVLNVTTSTAPTLSATTIVLNGALKIVPQGSGWVIGVAHTYADIISASSSLSGSFTSVTASNDFLVSLIADGSKAFSLSVTGEGAGASPPPTSSSIPAVNDFIAGLSGDNNPVAQSLSTAINSLTAPQLQNAATQLSGPATAQNITALRGVSSGLANSVQQRLLAGGGYTSSDVMSLNMVGNHLQMAALTGTPLFPMLPPGDRLSGWMRGFGSFASGAAQNGVAGFNQDRSGVIFGADEKLDANWTMGLAAQYARTDLRFTDGSASSGTNSYNGVLYGGWHDGPLYVNGTAGFGWNNYNSSRSLNIGGFTANPSGGFSGQDYTASTELGYALHATDDLTLTPYVGLDYTYTHTDGFTESGDGVTNLIIAPGSSNSLISTLGLRASTPIKTSGNGILTPEIHLAWEHENMDQSQSVNAAFLSSPGNTFSIAGAQYGRDSATVGLALTQELSRHSRVFLTYDARLNGGYTEHALSGGFRFTF